VPMFFLGSDMFKPFVLIATVVGFVVVGLSTEIYAESFRPGATPAGGKIAKFCNNDLMTNTEQRDCIQRFKKAKTDEQRRELITTVQETLKERQKGVDEAFQRANPGGRDAFYCEGARCQ